MQRQLVDVTKQIDNFAAATERRFAQMSDRNAASFAKLGSQLKSSASGLTSVFAPFLAALSVREVVEYADSWVQLTNKLKSASAYANIQARSLSELNQMAMAARAPLENYVSLYSRILNVSESLHLKETEVAEVTDLVSKAFKIGGATAAQQAGGIIQLTEALDMGFVQGRQLRALSTDAIVVSQALAAYFHTTVGGLKKLGSEGKITSEDLVQALLAYQGKINTAFKATSSTIGEAVQNIANAFTEFVGTAGQSSGAIAALVSALNFLAQNFKDIAPEIVLFASVLGAAFLGKAVAGLIVGIVEGTVALGTFLSAVAAGEVTIGIFTAAMAPIAIIAAAAAVGIGYLMYAQGDAARAAKAHTDALNTNATALDTAKTASEQYRESLRRQIQLQIDDAKTALAAAQAHLALAEHQGSGMAAAAGLVGLMFGEGTDSRVKAENTAKGNVVNPASQQLAEAQAFLDGLQKQLDALDKMGPGKPGTGDGSGDSTSADKLQKTIDGINGQTAALLAETAAQRGLNPLVNDYGAAVDYAKTRQQLLTDAMKDGVAITPQVVASIEAAAHANADASVQSKKLAEAQDEARKSMEDYFSTAKDAAKGFIDDLVAGKSAAEALGNAFSKLGSKLEDMGLDALFGTGNGANPFGLLGQLFLSGGGGGAGRPATGLPPLFANGGVTTKPAIFGDAGAEAAVPLPDGRRIPVDLRMPQAANNNTPSIIYAPVIDARGADQASVDRLERVLAKQSAEFDARVVGTLRKVKHGGVKV